MLTRTAGALVLALAIAVAIPQAGATLDVRAQQPASGPAQPPAAAVLRNYRPVTAERLRAPEPHNWLSIRRTYDGQAFSPLTELTTGNVARLKLVWRRDTDQVRVHESAPLVNEGVMFVTTPTNQVIALDAKSGTVLWRYRRPRPAGAFILHDTNRGVALYGDKVYFAAGEAVLVALDARSGRELWATNVADNSSSYYLTMAPLIANGMVMVGASGGEFGVRGLLAAFDPETGKELWKTYTVPAPGEPGHETWPKGGEQWKTGGAPVWVTGNYDPETNLAYWGTGNGGPWMGDQRPGDNLYTASTVAVDVATGRIKGHFQYNPNESWDWDEVSPPILVDYQRGGRTVKGLIDVARNGFIYFLERTKGPINFVDGKPFVTNNVYRSLNPKTGYPDVDPARKPATGTTAQFCPNAHGGKNWPPIAFSPQTRLVYVPANNNVCGTLTGVPITYERGKSFAGALSGAPFAAPGARHVGGEVQAWNVDTGQRAWLHEYQKTPNWGSMLATAGGLVFTGGTVDRKIHAFDAATGKLLWEFETRSGIVAPPTTFAVGGKQYLAVLSGWGGDASGMQRTMNRIFPGEIADVPEGGEVLVFALE
jgi:alcohol dehydrogenase (cytochrome c)